MLTLLFQWPKCHLKFTQCILYIRQACITMKRGFKFAKGCRNLPVEAASTVGLLLLFLLSCFIVQLLLSWFGTSIVYIIVVVDMGGRTARYCIRLLFLRLIFFFSLSFLAMAGALSKRAQLEARPGKKKCNPLLRSENKVGGMVGEGPCQPTTLSFFWDF